MEPTKSELELRIKNLKVQLQIIQDTIYPESYHEARDLMETALLRRIHTIETKKRLLFS